MVRPLPKQVKSPDTGSIQVAAELARGSIPGFFRHNGSPRSKRIPHCFSELGVLRPIVRMTWYVRDLAEYRAALAELGGIYRTVMGRHYPAMALVAVTALAEKEARLEIEATAVLPD